MLFSGFSLVLSRIYNLIKFSFTMALCSHRLALLKLNNKQVVQRNLSNYLKDYFCLYLHHAQQKFLLDERVTWYHLTIDVDALSSFDRFARRHSSVLRVSDYWCLCNDGPSDHKHVICNVKRNHQCIIERNLDEEVYPRKLRKKTKNYTRYDLLPRSDKYLFVNTQMYILCPTASTCINNIDYANYPTRSIAIWDYYYDAQDSNVTDLN